MMLGQQMIYIRDRLSLCEVTLAESCIWQQGLPLTPVKVKVKGCHHVPCLKKKPQDQEEEDGWCYLYLMARIQAISWPSHGHFMGMSWPCHAAHGQDPQLRYQPRTAQRRQQKDSAARRSTQHKSC